MSLDPITAGIDLVSSIGTKLVDRLFPDKVGQAKERQEFELQYQAAANDYEVKQTQAKLSAIIAEAQSQDPWTSRARPSFLYVIYIMLLASIPIGVLSAFKPDMATAIANGMGSWLKAIPDSLYALFGAGYLGYTGVKGYENRKRFDKTGVMK